MNQSILSRCEIEVTAYQRTQVSIICDCKIACAENERLIFTIMNPHFEIDWNMDGDLYICAFLTSYINKNQKRDLEYPEVIEQEYLRLTVHDSINNIPRNYSRLYDTNRMCAKRIFLSS